MRKMEILYRVVIEKGRHNGDYTAAIMGAGLGVARGMGQSPSEAAGNAFFKAGQRLEPAGRRAAKANKARYGQPSRWATGYAEAEF